jgi:flagellar basal body-associated protein FliL
MKKKILLFLFITVIMITGATAFIFFVHGKHRLAVCKLVSSGVRESRCTTGAPMMDDREAGQSLRIEAVRKKIAEEKNNKNMAQEK